MASITKSTSRLVWAMSLLGLDRLSAFFTSSSPWDQPDHGVAEQTVQSFDTLSDQVRELIGPTFRSMLDTGDRILDRLFGNLDALDAEQELPWPFPTAPYDDHGPLPDVEPYAAPPESDVVQAPGPGADPAATGAEGDVEEIGLSWPNEPNEPYEPHEPHDATPPSAHPVEPHSERHPVSPSGSGSRSAPSKPSSGPTLGDRGALRPMPGPPDIGDFFGGTL